MRFAIGSRCGLGGRLGVLLAVATCAALAAAGALAAPYTVPLNYTTISGIATASGSVTFDDSLLSSGGTEDQCDASQITSFTLTVTGLSGSPSSTSFSKTDLTGWFLTIAPGGRITDLNFFMKGGPCPGKSNADGFVIEGENPFILELFSPTGAPVATFELYAPAIPALSPACAATAQRSSRSTRTPTPGL